MDKETGLKPQPSSSDSSGEQRDEDAGGDLRGKVARGSLWTLVGYGSSQAFRLLNNLILWRLLFPEVFGLMALVNVFLAGIALFTDIGIGPSIVQHKRGNDPTYLNTAWTIQVIRQFILCLVACLLAHPVAAFYGQSQLSILIPAAALASLPSGFNSTRLFTQTRELSLGRLTSIDLLSQTIGLAVMIVWAWVHPDVWALIAGSLLSSVVRLILSHTFLPGIRNQFRWDRESVRHLLHFGRWIFFSTILMFMVMHSDRIVFGKLIPVGLLGVYSIAATWAGVPTAVVSRLLSAVIFPLLSRLQHDRANLSMVYLQARRPWMLLAGWAAAGLMCGGPTLIQLLYEARATEAGWIIQILAVGVWLQTLESANCTALLALGQPKWLAIGNACKLAGMIALIPLGHALYGFPGAVAGFAGSELLHYASSVIGTRRYKVASLAQDLLFTALVFATAGCGVLASKWLSPAIRALSIRPAKLGIFFEGLLIAVCVSIGWACFYFVGRPKKVAEKHS